MQLLSRFYNIKFLLPFLGAVLLLYIYSLWGRIPDIDDAWLGEYAFWLEKLGYVRSELMRGITGQESRFIVHHKFLTIHGAAFIRLFGFSLYSLKAVSLVYLLVFIALFYVYTVKWQKLFDKTDFLFSMIILFSFTLVFKYSFLFRPEIMVMCIGFAGYIFLEKYLTGNRQKIWYVFISGLFFGLTVFTHLNSVALVSTSALLLFWNKKYRAVFVFGAGAVLTTLLYFYDFQGLDSIKLWKHQFFDSPSIDSLAGIPAILKPVVNILSEHQRYFHDPEIIVFSVFMFVTLIAGSRVLYKKHTDLVKFTILAAFFTGLLTMHKSRQYILPFFPYILIMITLTFRAIKDKKVISFPFIKRIEPRLFQGIFIFFTTVFLAMSAFINFKLAYQKFPPEYNRELAMKYAGNNVSEMNIVAPFTFIFNEINYFQRIQGDLCYSELSKINPDFSGEGFFEKAASYDISVVIVSKHVASLLGIENMEPGEKHGEYYCIDKNPELIVFKRKE